jgi:hypothetical protein
MYRIYEDVHFVCIPPLAMFVGGAEEKRKTGHHNPAT